MTQSELLALAHKNRMNLDRQQEAFDRLWLAFDYGQPVPPTPEGFSDAQWRAAVNRQRAIYEEKKRLAEGKT